MKKLLPYILILVLSVGLFAPVFQIDAQSTSVGPSGFPVPTGGATPNSTVVSTSSGPNCSLNPLTWKTCVVNGLSDIIAQIAYMFLSITSLLLWLAGTLLDYVLKTTIINMAQNISSLTGINIGWKLLRDLMNISFIFTLIYYAIKLIIAQDDIQTIRKFITAIVLASLLINFSLFFTKIIIDASNIVTIGIYNSILDNSIIDVANATSADNGRSAISGLSVPFMRRMGLSGFFSGQSFSNLRANTGGNMNMILFPIMGIILFVIVSFIFFAVSILFVIRYIVLVLLLMLSPIAYMGSALPFLGTYADRWWKSFWGQILFAPIYMLMTWVVLTLMSSKGFVTTGDWGAVLTNTNTSVSNGSISLVFNFVIIVGLMIASLIIAKDTASKGDSLIGKMQKNLTAYAGGAVLGSAAAVSRRTVGAGASRLAENRNLQSWAGRSAIGQRVLNTTRTVGSSSLDLRRSRAAEAIASQTNTDLGRGTVFNKNAGQGGYTQTVVEKAKKTQDFANTLRDDQAKRDFAIRQADKWYVRQGSRSAPQTAFGVMGRGNRIAAARILRAQVDPLQTNLDNLNNSTQNQQNRDTQLNQQLSALNSEMNTLTNTQNRNAQQNQRLAQLTGPANTGGSIANLQGQITANTAAMANTQAQIAQVQAQIAPLNAEIDRLGLNNPRNTAPLTPNQIAQNNAAIAAGNPPPHAPRPLRADEQQF